MYCNDIEIKEGKACWDDVMCCGGSAAWRSVNGGGTVLVKGRADNT